MTVDPALCLVPAAALVLIALSGAACGGKVVVDVEDVGAGGSAGGAGGTGVGGRGATSSSTGTGPCTATAAPGNAILTVCVGMASSGGCQQDQLATQVSMLMQDCPNDPFCGCVFGFVSAPCPPSAGCCYQVEVTQTPTVCE